MKRYKKWWILTVSIILVTFVLLSVQRYRAVNEKYKDYRIVEHLIDFNDLITVEDASFIFKKPKITEHDEYFEYEIPLEIKNNGENLYLFPFDHFLIMNNFVENQVSLEKFKLVNEEIGDGIAPNTEREVILFFELYKDWGIKGDEPTDLYFYQDIDGIMNKYKLPLS